MAFKIALGVWMSAVIIAAFLFVPSASGFTQSRIIFFHVPVAMISAAAFIVSMVYAWLYLKRRNLIDDAKSAISAELGLLFAVLATITGSIFAHVEWGSLWNWDPRETSIVILLLIYAAYFALRSAIDGTEKRASLSAVYAILALPAMVFLVFVLPRLTFSLHPSGTLTTKSGLSAEYRLVLYSAAIGFFGIYIWLFRMAIDKHIRNLKK